MTPPAVDRIAPPARDAFGLPEAAQPHGSADPADRETEEGESEEHDEEAYRSLVADVEALFEDGKTYLQAEVAYQKTRAAFVADRAKGAFVYGALAAVFGFLALIGLTVGLIIALTPWLTAWGASAVVVLLLLAVAGFALQRASRSWAALMGAIGSDGEPKA